MKSIYTELSITSTLARKLALKMVFNASSGHLGGSLSCMDLLTTLYFHTMRINPEKPEDPERDRFIMSKGHCSPAMYAVLALRGFFPQENLKYYRSIEGHMSGHVEISVPGVDMSTGSLSQGLSVALGMALGGKVNKKDYRVYAIVGDGELDEGQIWECLMAAAKYKLDNFCPIIDVIGLQIDGPTCKVMPLEPLDEKLEAFGMHVIKINGHDFSQIISALEEAAAVKGQPSIILAKTVKGKGISFMENVVAYQGKVPDESEYQKAISELDNTIKQLEE